MSDNPGRRIFDQHMNDDGTFRDLTVVDIPPGIAIRALNDRDAAAQKLAAVTYLHQADETGKACDGCGQTMPCSTRRILDRSRP